MAQDQLKLPPGRLVGEILELGAGRFVWNGHNWEEMVDVVTASTRALLEAKRVIESALAILSKYEGREEA